MVFVSNVLKHPLPLLYISTTVIGFQTKQLVSTLHETAIEFVWK